MKLLNSIRATVLGILLVASLSLNFATVAFSSVATLVSGAYEALTGATSAVGSLRRDLSRSDTKLASMSEELQTKNQRIEGLSDELVIKDKKIGALGEEVANLKQSQKVAYRGQTRLVSEAVEDFSARVSRRTAASATRNAGSVVAEAIPIAGIAAIVAVTAWDLKDSCETMEDLHELNVAFNPDLALPPDVKEVCGLEIPTKEEVWQRLKTSPREAWEAAKRYTPDLPELSVPKLSDVIDLVRFWE